MNRISSLQAGSVTAGAEPPRWAAQFQAAEPFAFLAVKAKQGPLGIGLR